MGVVALALFAAGCGGSRGLGRFVFAQRVKGFWTVGPTSIPVKREIYPTWLEHSE